MSDFQDLLRAGAARKYDDETLKRELDRIFGEHMKRMAEKDLKKLESDILDRQRDGKVFSCGKVIDKWISFDKFSFRDEYLKIYRSDFNQADNEILLEAQKLHLIEDDGGYWRRIKPALKWVEVVSFEERTKEERFLFFKYKSSEYLMTTQFAPFRKIYLEHLRNLAEADGIMLTIWYQWDYSRDGKVEKAQRVMVPNGWDLNFNFACPISYSVKREREGKSIHLEIRYNLKSSQQSLSTPPTESDPRKSFDI